MAKAKDSFIMGNIELPYHLNMKVDKYNLTLVYWLPFYEMTVEEYLNKKLEASKVKGSTIDMKWEIQYCQNNGRYILETLPKELIEGQMKLQGRVWNVPLPSIAWELYQAIKRVNPLDRGREGNTNQVIFPNGKQTSIGSFLQLVVGISQTRQAPKGGNSGGYSPSKGFEGLIPLGYSAYIPSTSNQYDKARAMLEEQKAKAQEVKKPPVKKQNKKPDAKK